uniref:Variant surface glycoprotein 1125.2781 n=1 Tax=Trypanosoma brucei TaxID=5691 RepID=A0A1J0R8I6_9TRYP|nr:variant surface glycoprotein 1125.2781 [Trypanosoma brucei]
MTQRRRNLSTTDSFKAPPLRLIVAALALLFTKEGSSQSDGNAVQAVNDACTELAYLTHLKSAFGTAASTLADNVKKLTDEEKALELAAAMHSGTPTGAAFSFLAALAHRKSLAATRELQKAAGAVTTTALEISRRQGQLGALQHINAATTPEYSEAAKEGTPGNVIPSADMAVSVTLQLKTSKGNTACNTQDSEPKLKLAASELQTNTNYKGVEDKNFKPPATLLKIASKGNDPASMTTCAPQGGCSDTATYGGTNFLCLGSATTGKPAPLTATELSFTSNSECRQATKENSKEPAINRARLVHYLCTDRKDLPKTQKSIKSETVGSLTIDPVA